MGLKPLAAASQSYSWVSASQSESILGPRQCAVADRMNANRYGRLVHCDARSFGRDLDPAQTFSWHLMLTDFMRYVRSGSGR